MKMIKVHRIDNIFDEQYLSLIVFRIKLVEFKCCSHVILLLSTVQLTILTLNSV